MIVQSATVRVDDHVHDVLNVFRLVFGSEAHFFERVVLNARAGSVARIEFQASLPRVSAPARGKRPILALENVYQRGMRPREERWCDNAGTFSTSRGCEYQNVAGSGIAQIARAPTVVPSSQV